MKFFIYCLFASLLFSCSGGEKYVVMHHMGGPTVTRTVQIPVEEWNIYWTWDVTEDEDKYLAWHPAYAENELLYTIIPAAATLNGFSSRRIEKFTEKDSTRHQYLLVVYSREKLEDKKVTFYLKIGETAERFEFAKKRGEDWMNFYHRAFDEMSEEWEDIQDKLRLKMDAKFDIGTEEEEPEEEEPEEDPAAALEAARQACVDKINEFRKTFNLGPLQRWNDAETCSDEQAKKDAAGGTAHANFQQCQEMAQDTCPGGYASYEEANTICIQQMWDEGPEPNKCDAACQTAHGHFTTMVSFDYSKVACGFHVADDGQVWVNHNFAP